MWAVHFYKRSLFEQSIFNSGLNSSCNPFLKKRRIGKKKCSVSYSMRWDHRETLYNHRTWFFKMINLRNGFSTSFVVRGSKRRDESRNGKLGANSKSLLLIREFRHWIWFAVLCKFSTKHSNCHRWQCLTEKSAWLYFPALYCLRNNNLESKSWAADGDTDPEHNFLHCPPVQKSMN